MPKLTLIDDPGHWRQRAREARSVADQLDDPKLKQTMLDIAQSYQQLAALAEKRSASVAQE